MTKPRIEAGRAASRRRCDLNGCPAARYEQGLCRAHFQRAAALGETSAMAARGVLMLTDRAHGAAEAVAGRRARNAARVAGCALERWLDARRTLSINCSGAGPRVWVICSCACHGRRRP